MGVLNKTAYPELLGTNATAENIMNEIKRLSRADVRKKMISDLKSADKLWHRKKSAAKIIAQDIVKPS